eukprot:182968_1
MAHILTVYMQCIAMLKSLEFDYIVVGSSTGGIVASRLAESRHNVLLIESGPNDATYSCESCGNIVPSGDFLPRTTLLPASNTFQNTQSSLKWFSNTPNGQFWNYDKTVLNRSVSIVRAKVLGGCSTHNGLVWMRGDHRDYDYVSDILGLNTWGFHDVSPYFMKTESYFGNYSEMRGLNGPVKIIQRPFQHWEAKLQTLYDTFLMNNISENNNQNGANNAGGISLIDLNQDNYNNYENVGTYNSIYFRGSTAESYIRKIGSKTEYLKVWTNITVQRILFEYDEKHMMHKAVGVEYWNNSFLNQVYCNKEVIISAGVYQSPSLLMLSGIGPMEQLNLFNITPILINDNIGRYGQEHFYLDVIYEVNDTLTNISYLLQPEIELGVNWVNFTRSALNVLNTSFTFDRLGIYKGNSTWITI